MTPPRRPATGLPDHQVEKIIVGLILLRGELDVTDACSAIVAARTKRNAGDRDWPRDLAELEAALPTPGRRLWLVAAALARAETYCPSGAA